MNMLLCVLLLFNAILMLVAHELGHVVEAKWEGIFKGFRFDHLGVYVLLTVKHSRYRSAYLVGILGSFSILPLWLLTVSLPIWASLLVFLGVALGLGVQDLISYAVYPKIVEASENKAV